MSWRRIDPGECASLAAAPQFERLDAHAIWGCLTGYRGYQRPPGTRLPVALELTADVTDEQRLRIAQIIAVAGVYDPTTDRFWTGWVNEAQLPLLSAEPGVARWRFGMPQNRKA